MVCDSFTWFFLLSVGLMCVAASVDAPLRTASRFFLSYQCHRAGLWPPAGAARANRESSSRPPSPNFGAPSLQQPRTPFRESDIPSLEAYARQFDEAIEKIRLRRQGLRGRGDR